MRFRFVSICNGCPEDYNILLSGRVVGYLRIRWGVVKIYFGRESSQLVIYQKTFQGDPWKGCFEGDEREYFFNLARKLIRKRIFSLIPK